MLRAVRMVHLRIQVPSKDAAAVTRRIARAGVLHLIDLAHGRIPGSGAPERTLDLLAAFRDLAQRIRSLADKSGALLPDPRGRLPDPEGVEFDAERAAIESELRPHEKTIAERWQALERARQASSEARDAFARAERLERAGIDALRLSRLRLATIHLAAGDDAAFGQVAALLEPSPFAIVPLEAGEGGLAAICVPSSALERLDSALRLAAVEAFQSPSAAESLERLRHAAQDAAVTEEAALAAMAAGKDAASAALAPLLARAELGVVLLQAQASFATAGRFTVLSGWLPESDADRLRREIETVTEGRAVIDVERPEDVPEVARGALKVPILHRNPLLLRPFQSLVGLYGTPSYEEVEPTAFFAVSFLAMFGLMFGDVGHGAVLFAAGWIAFRRIPRFLDYGLLLMEAGAFSVAFGVLYGSVFGVEDLVPALWMRPLHDLQRFMVVAAAAGAVLVSLGLALNVVNLWRSGQRASAFYGTQGLFGAFLYWVLLGLAIRAVVGDQSVLPLWAPVALALVAALLLALRPLIVRLLDHGKPARPRTHTGSRWLWALEGSIELVDTVFTFFASTVSFVRIAAFAAVHAGIFVALFALADTLAHVRFGGVVSAVVLVAGNAVAILLEGLTVSVQVLRLEYYEFFTRFFRGGGEPYRPLQLHAKEAPP